MKLSRNAVRRKSHAVPTLRFEQQRLTSFAGLLLFQVLFGRLDLKRRLRACFETGGAIYHRATIVLSLIVHLLLGYRQLRDSRYYRDDPMVRRLLGLARLPDVATVSRCLAEASIASIERVRRLCRELVLERLVALAPRRLTLDFDGSVISTGRWAEGTAVGFNRKKKGQRSYYPLFCTLAQTGQVFDLLHRPGNVHDSRGAREFLIACIEQIRAVLPGVVLEVRLDSAFFSDEIVRILHELGVEFSDQRPLRALRRAQAAHREPAPLVPSQRRDLLLRGSLEAQELAPPLPLRLPAHRHRRRSKQPVQLDLFEPVDTDFRLHRGGHQQDRHRPARRPLPPRPRSPGGRLRRARSPRGSSTTSPPAPSPATSSTCSPPSLPTTSIASSR